MAGTGQSGVQVGRRKPVIQDGPAGEILSGSSWAGYGRWLPVATGKHPAGHLVGGYRGQGSELWQTVESGEVPAHYVAQVQHQLMVSGAAVAHLWVFDGTLGLLLSLIHI